MLDVLRSDGRPDVERVSEIALKDPVPEVRRFVFKVLVDMLPGHQHVQHVARQLARDPSFDDRVTAALMSGDPELLAHLTASDQAWDGARAEALEKMATLHEWPDRRVDACVHAYRNGGEQDRAAALAALGLAGESALVNDVAQRLSSLSPKEAVVTLAYIEKFKELVPELAALVALKTGDEWTQWGAVSELERHGAPESVSHLLLVAEDPEVAFRVKRRAEDAVVAISKRHGLGSGRVSVATDPAASAGQVSDSTGGQVSEEP